MSKKKIFPIVGVHRCTVPAVALASGCPMTGSPTLEPPKLCLQRCAEQWLHVGRRSRNSAQFDSCIYIYMLYDIYIYI